MAKMNIYQRMFELRRLPHSSREVKRRLDTLWELDKRFNPNFERDQFFLRGYSKRQERLVKMYWAFRRMEAKA